MADYVAPGDGLDSGAQDVSQQSTAAPMPDAKGVPESDKALVKKILSNIKQDKKHHEKAFKRMRRDMGVALRGYDEANWSATAYSANISGRHVKQKTAQLYAKNPKVVARRRDMMDFAVWDENPDTLKMAYMQLMQFQQQQQMYQQVAASAPVDQMTGAQVDPSTGQPLQGPPPPPPGLEMAQQTLQDFQQGTQIRQTAAKVGKTLELVFEYQLESQQPMSFKQGMKQGVRRAITTGVAYAEWGWQRAYGPRPGLLDQLQDARTRLDHLQALTKDAQDGDIQEGDAEAAELQYMIQGLQAEPDVLMREGLIIDFPRATKVIPDRLCTMLEGFQGARHLAIEYLYTKDEVQELFNVDLKQGEYQGYTVDGKDDERPIRRFDDTTTEDSGDTNRRGRTASAGLCCVYKYYDKSAGLVYYVCDGYTDFLKPPAPPDVTVEDFWPVRSLTFNAVEHETELFPPSDVYLLRSMQDDYNRSRQGQREHRKAARPRWAYQRGALDDDDIETLKNAEPFDAVALNTPQGSKLADILQAIPVPGVDPNLYATDQYFTDTQLVVGSQAATLGGISDATATESSISAGAMATADGSSVDELDAFLTSLVRAGGQILFKEMDPASVTKIAGVGSVWPQMDDQQIAEQVQLEIQAGSTGKPNQAQEVNNWKEMLPFLIQMPNISPMWLARETIRRLDDNADLTEAITENIPSVVAQNAQAAAGPQPQPAPGDASKDPKAQGPEGANNGPPPPAGPGGSSAPMGANNMPPQGAPGMPGA